MKHKVNIEIFGKTFKKEIKANTENEAMKKAQTQFVEFVLKNMKIEIEKKSLENDNFINFFKKMTGIS
ncbi:MAG: hypothetical protein GY849_02445 [Deltaproteobacteria bacterium]|nr:hypothetical protein [Deltaproteobacteria bacterium]